MSDEPCPVVVYAAPDVPQEKLYGLVCHNCGRALTAHELRRSEFVTPGMAYATRPILTFKVGQ